MSLNEDDPAVMELLYRYERWRSIYQRAGRPPRDVPDWENGRLFFRELFPHPDWSAFVIEAVTGGYRVLDVSTERRIEPLETSNGFFSELPIAGKFIIAKIADYLRINCRMDPIYWTWQDAGLDPLVDAIVESDHFVTYVLRSDPSKYCVMTRGDMPSSHILPLTYDELDNVFLEGFPEGVTSPLAQRTDGET